MDEYEELDRLAEQLAGAAAAYEASVEEWSRRQFTGTADEEGIVATVDAMGNLVSLQISLRSKRRHDGVTLGDAVVTAVHAAEQAAAEAQETMMRSGPAGIGGLLADAQRSFERRGGLQPD
ncbi:YbaB/EbfC family nucleoid-associated protein [Nonomuraea sp. bgisy101]|uniref:YbaB/EbfC family nucleoid-associated protein n=1 Tax=Nonomuraea sp. bgisy101 TaxID=3413784 RepID=UPI003D7150C5